LTNFYDSLAVPKSVHTIEVIMTEKESSKKVDEREPVAFQLTEEQRRAIEVLVVVRCNLTVGLKTGNCVLLV